MNLRPTTVTELDAFVRRHGIGAGAREINSALLLDRGGDGQREFLDLGPWSGAGGFACNTESLGRIS